MVRGEGLRRACWVAIAIAACGKTPARLPQRAIIGSLEPTTPSTVITIQTTLQPQKTTVTHSITIANGRARSDDELDRWRFFDLDKNTITYVDDLSKTYYTVGAEPRPPAAGTDGGPTLQPTGAKRMILGVEASQFLIRMGAYQRELWIAAPPSIPPGLFAMMHDGPGDIRGFPLVDHAELPYGKSKMIVDHTVVKIEQKDVPLSLLRVGSDYKEITAPGASPPPASSPPPDQSTREAG